MDTKCDLWTLHWLYSDVLIKTWPINQIKQTIKNLIRILKGRHDTKCKGWQQIWCPLQQYWHILAKFMSVFANSYFEWLKYLQRNCDTIDRRSPGQFLAQMRSRDGKEEGRKWLKQLGVITTSPDILRNGQERGEGLIIFSLVWDYYMSEKWKSWKIFYLKRN